MLGKDFACKGDDVKRFGGVGPWVYQKAEHYKTKDLSKLPTYAFWKTPRKTSIYATPDFKKIVGRPRFYQKTEFYKTKDLENPTEKSLFAKPDFKKS